MHVSVTQEHIDRAKLYMQQRQHKARYCPVALSVCDLYHLEPPRVCAYIHIRLTVDGYIPLFKADTPLHVIEWMDAFDDGRPVSPIEFDCKLEYVYQEDY
jgi:hypothetical protein